MARYIRNYEILSELGSGHFGTVYAAVGEVPGRGLSAGLRRLVAVKKLKQADPHALHLLEQEFQLLDGVKHRGIVRVYEYLPDERAVVMEYIHGVTLRRMLDECSNAREQVFTEAAIEIVCELADALYQAWTTPGDNGEPLRLVHRDLKPDNIMLAKGGEVKILDFGLARVDNAEYAPDDADRIKGTPVYMAPEQASGGEVTHQSDLFSLGLIAYELFMNRPAYRVSANSPDPLGEIFDAIERGALHDEVRELETKLPGVGPIIGRLLESNPRSRYTNGQDLLVDLRRQLYRDRGSYLHEFCEFFYGSIYDLADPPDIDAPAARAPSRSGSGGARKRMSMEERLKASMARDKAARSAEGKPSTWHGNSVNKRREEARAEVWEPASTREPRRRDSSAASSSGSRSSGNRPKLVGARSPDETGMLEMVSLSNDSGSADKKELDNSATAFFAIPAPKENKRAKPTPAPATPAPAAAPPPAGMGGPVAGGPMAAPPPPAGGAPAAGIAQGPVASYGAAQQTPFQVGTNSPAPPPADSGQRTQSNRVYAIVLGIFFLVGVAIFAAVWFRPGAGDDAEAVAEVDESSSSSSTARETRKSSRDEENQDTAEEIAPPPETRTRRSSGGGTRRTGNTTTTTTSAAPKVAAGTLIVTVTGTTATSIEVTCPSGFRKRAAISGGKGTVNGVPGESCTVFFKGGAPAKYGPVSGGRSYSCAVSGTVASCK